MTQRTEVLIVGSGSAGVFAAAWLAKYQVPFTMLERRPGPLQIGQADGVQCRTVEIYDSFEISEEVLREAYHILEVCFWSDDGESRLVRKSRTADTETGLSYMPHVILNQARMNGLMLQKMEQVRAQSNAKEQEIVEYGWEVKSVDIDEETTDDQDAYCCRVTAKKDDHEQVWEAKYVLGCDGAHSIVRRSINSHMLGDTTNTVWGVMDIYPRTSFPDIRRKCTLHTRSGNLLLIPREGGSLVRFYIQLPPGSHPRDVRLSNLQSTARAIFAPFSLDFAETYWWSAYSIGQRLASSFHSHHRIFLTGDACHTHSPKAGQGMNVSLQDGYNLGWKLSSVLRGISSKSVLHTYVSERAQTAADLIAFDRVLSRKFSSREERPGEFAEYFMQSGRYMAGLATRYAESVVVDVKGSRQEVAVGCVVGERFPSAQVIRFCDCKAVQLQGVLRSDGRWRVVVFAGGVDADGFEARLNEVARNLEPLARRYTPYGHSVDSLIEPIILLRSVFSEVDQEQIPGYFWPVTGKWNIRVYVDDEHYNAGHGHAYEKYGVNPEEGAVVIVRPDQHISKVTTLEDSGGIASFFQECLIPRREGHDKIDV